ncbi:hypothetical protein DOQ08_00291 [Marinobacter litoralis]|uniref:Uncharacterized protein n=1 Tax=Marinobacter litoralis TaxID=187981 RepID=A0A3M2RJW9_9GAMM|nr:hypothetical protein [Marinobacter litoralis]RMJ05621.1 hypothetical protein DOQ08_00291 [Marinobacter litoralis]
MKFKACFLAATVLVTFNAMATEPEAELGLSGVNFQPDNRTDVRKIFDQQAEQKTEGGELSMALYAKTQKRLAESFDQSMPDRIGESSSGD